MYVLQGRRYPSLKASMTGMQWSYSYHLYEMTKKEFTACEQGENRWHDHVSAAAAHRMVRDGVNHSTALYIDFDGRVRKARDSY